MTFRLFALLAVLAAGLLAACAQQTCRERGYSPGTAAYDACQEQLRMTRPYDRHFAPHPRRRGD